MSDLGKYAYDLAGILRNVLRKASTEVDNVDWSSTASASFLASWKDCQDGGEKIIDTLSTMAESLGITASNIGIHDNQFATAFAVLNVPMLDGAATTSTPASSSSTLNLPEL